MKTLHLLAAVVCTTALAEQPSYPANGGARAVNTIASGAVHTCALKDDGSVWCWGVGGFGQLGVDNVYHYKAPGKVKVLTNAISIAAGTTTTCAVTADGGAWCWGNNGVGQAGIGQATQPQLVPAKVLGIDDAKAITTSGTHACALLANGTVKCWGHNGMSQLGIFDNVTPFQTAPTQAAIGVTDAVSVQAGNGFTCVQVVGGFVKCWGANDKRQLGDGTTTKKFNAVFVMDGPEKLGNVASLAVGTSHACAVLGNGMAKCWGMNDHGQLGMGSVSASGNAVYTQDLGAPILGIAAGDGTTCARLTNGVKCWGMNDHHLLGNPAVSAPESLTAVSVATLDRVASISVARDRSMGFMACAVIYINGAIKCWGAADSGQLGNNTNVYNSEFSTPQLVYQLTHAGSSKLALSGHRTSCLARHDSHGKCWGANEQQGLGNQSSNDSAIPVVSEMTYFADTMIAPGERHTCSLGAQGVVGCFGRGSEGQLGDTSYPIQTGNYPIGVVGTEQAVQVVSGSNHSCALLADGKVKCWGKNDHGQLGNNSWDNSATAKYVVSAYTNEPIFDIRMLAAHYDTTCALTTGNTVMCWGANDADQMNVGHRDDSWSATAVFYSSKTISIAVGEKHLCLLQANSKLTCNGANDRGQFGDGTSGRSFMKSSTITTEGAVAIAAGSQHTCLLTAAGKVMCMGRGTEGQLGDDDSYTDKSKPVYVWNSRGPLTNVVSISTGSQHTLAVKPTSLVTWGANDAGQLGANDFSFLERWFAAAVQGAPLN